MAKKPVAKSQGVTINDIAKAAKVGTATVSRTLNHPDLVRADTRKAILKVVGELGYIRSGAAMALASKQTYTVGAIIPTFNNAIFAASIAGFEQALSKENYTLLVTVSNFNPNQETKKLHKLLERGIDAVLLIGQDHSPALFELLKNSGCCVVSIFGGETAGKIPSIGFDNKKASEEIVDHLVTCGHRRIGMIAGITTHNDRARDRKNGVIDALKSRDIPCDPNLFLESQYSHHQGRAAFGKLINHPNPPSAVICGNDVLAMAALFEASFQDIAVPDQVSITGFDNLPITEHLKPSLTTIDIPSEEMGIIAAQSIIQNLTTGKTIESQTLPANLLIRETTGKAPSIIPTRAPNRPART